MKRERLEGVWLKLARAEHNIQEVHDAIVGYLAEENFELVGEFNRQTSEYAIRGEVTKSTSEIGVIAGDVLHNLRSALDHLAWQLALLTTTTPYALTQFPLAFTEDEFGSRRGQRTIGTSRLNTEYASRRSSRTTERTRTGRRSRSTICGCCRTRTSTGW